MSKKEKTLDVLLKEKEDLSTQLSKMESEKEKVEEKLSNKKYKICLKRDINIKKILYLLSKVEWQGKEALGNVRINDLISNGTEPNQKVDKSKDYFSLNPVQINALYYLMLKVKSNSLHDAKLYVEFMFPLVNFVEKQVAKAKKEYTDKINPLNEDIEKKQKEIQEIELKITEKEISNKSKEEKNDDNK